MDVGGQKVIISSGRNRDRFPLRLAPGIVHIGQRCAVIESPQVKVRHAVRDRHAGQRCMSKRKCQLPMRASRCPGSTRWSEMSTRGTLFESSQRCNNRKPMRVTLSGIVTLRQRSAMRESRIVNACHAVRNRHVCQRCATSESVTDNACHAVRDHTCRKLWDPGPGHLTKSCSDSLLNRTPDASLA